jgi:catechol 2,3-dioxygenase-like lactoylglutathione lyase family enzyme
MRYVVGVAWFVVFSLWTNAAASAESLVQVSRVDCPSISVASLDAAVAFYTGVLNFEVKEKTDASSAARVATGMSAEATASSAELTLGSECLILTEYHLPEGRPFPEDSRANDFWFEHVAIVVSDMDAAYARLQEAHVHFVSNIPQTLPMWNKEAAGISAFYFRDIDGHYLEFIHFPAGKGQPKWQVVSGKIFLGIDHTAIAVSDTSRSLHFYRDALHMRVTGGSENYGAEQEHLSGVFNAHVLITSLRAESGIGVELLQYISPISGRPIPTDVRVSDIACWQIRMHVPTDTSSSTSPEIQGAAWKKLPSNDREMHKATWIKDPDGHLLELIE